MRNLVRLSHLSQVCFSVTVLAEVTVPAVCPASAAQTSEPLDSEVLNCCSLEHMVGGKLFPILDCLKTLHCELWQFRKWVMSSSDVQAGSTAGTSIFVSCLIPAHQSDHRVPKSEWCDYLPVCSQAQNQQVTPALQHLSVLHVFCFHLWLYIFLKKN